MPGSSWAAIWPPFRATGYSEAMQRGVSRRRGEADTGSNEPSGEVIETTLAPSRPAQAVDDGSLSETAIKRVIRDWCGSREREGEYQIVCHAMGTTPLLLLLQMLADPASPLPPRVRADMLLELTKRYVPAPAPVHGNEDEGAGAVLGLGGFMFTAGVQAPDGSQVVAQVTQNKEKQ